MPVKVWRILVSPAELFRSVAYAAGTAIAVGLTHGEEKLLPVASCRCLVRFGVTGIGSEARPFARRAYCTIPWTWSCATASGRVCRRAYYLDLWNRRAGDTLERSATVN